MIQQALSDAEISDCYPIMLQLRPHLESDSFVAIVRKLKQDGYHLVYIANEGRPVVLAGYRIYNNLFMGKHLYVDDLVTDNKVCSQGFGQQMVAWLKQQAVKQQCQVLHLDSGTHRHSAHKFYLNQGFTIASFHFSQPIKDS